MFGCVQKRGNIVIMTEFNIVSHDETCLNVESSRILEKGTLVCRNVVSVSCKSIQCSNGGVLCRAP